MNEQPLVFCNEGIVLCDDDLERIEGGGASSVLIAAVIAKFLVSLAIYEAEQCWPMVVQVMAELSALNMSNYPAATGLSLINDAYSNYY